MHSFHPITNCIYTGILWCQLFLETSWSTSNYHLPTSWVCPVNTAMNYLNQYVCVVTHMILAVRIIMSQGTLIVTNSPIPQKLQFYKPTPTHMLAMLDGVSDFKYKYTHPGFIHTRQLFVPPPSHDACVVCVSATLTIGLPGRCLRC